MVDLLIKYPLALVCLLLAAIAGYYCLQTSHLRASLAESQVQLELWRDRVNQQNQVIDNWKKEAQTLADQVKKTQQAAEKSRQKALDNANRIIHADVPKDCLKAVEWAIEQAK